MRVHFALAAAVALVLGVQARAEDPAKPDLGAGPHRDSQPMEGGNGERLRPGQPEPRVPEPSAVGKPAAKDGASAGSSSQDREDERRATESKEKAKRRPGYKDEAPSPRG